MTKRILELNPQHALVTGLRDKQGGGDADPDVARLLYGMALLAEGGELKEPTAFVNTLADRLQKTL